ncbi:FAD-binding oxidoreductase [bacterium]|nr:FAD-binding oxidoreductase [bacterium]
MKISDLPIKGNIHTDEAALKRLSRDASSYRIKPHLIAEPGNEEDVLKVLEYTQKKGGNITCRSGGSGLSGAAVGTDIILNFKPLMNKMRRRGEEMVAEPGAVLKDFLQKVNNQGLMLPAVPSSSAWCALGGNIGTRSTGPRTARYGTIDFFVSSLRFITAGGEIVDTREKLPDFFENGLLKIRDRFLADQKSRQLFEQRPFIAGGYNIQAFSQYEDPKELTTHLLVGSIGTLAIVTEIRLKLIPFRPSLGTYVAFFRSLDELGSAIKKISDLCPSAMEFVDATTLSHIQGRILNASDASITGALLVEFDESSEQAERGRAVLESFDLSRLRTIPVGSKDEADLWGERRRILPSLWGHARKKNWILPSIIDDVAIHLNSFPSVFRDLRQLMADLGHEIAIFGHIGFGSLHARPFFEPQRGDLVEQIMTVSRETFQLLQKYGGTLVGEHNAGRSRSAYLEMELGKAFGYLRDLKQLFDPDDVLNPNTLFDLDPITSHMDLSR